MLRKAKPETQHNRHSEGEVPIPFKTCAWIYCLVIGLWVQTQVRTWYGGRNSRTLQHCRHLYMALINALGYL